jgi:hypothetical protein
MWSEANDSKELQLQSLCKEDRAIDERTCVVEDCGVVVEEDGAEQGEGTPGTIFRGEWWQWEPDPWQSESRQEGAAYRESQWRSGRKWQECVAVTS